MVAYLKKLNQLIESRVSEFGAQYFALAVFCCLNHPIYYITWRFFDEQSYESLFLRTTATLICIPLLFTKKWPASFKIWLPTYWYFVVTFNLSFFFFYMLLMNSASNVWLMSTTVIIFWLLFLVDWASYLVLMTIGVSIAWITYLIMRPVHAPDFNYIGLATQYVGSVAVLVVFARKRIKFDREKFMTIKLIGGSLAHETRTPLLAISSGSIGLRHHLNTYLSSDDMPASIRDLCSKEILPEINVITENIEKEAKHISNFVDVISSNILHGKKVYNNLIEVNVAICLQDILKNDVNLAGEMVNVEVLEPIDLVVLGDEVLIKHVISNLLKNAVFSLRKSRKGHILIWTSIDESYSCLHIKDTGLGISKKQARQIFKPFYTTKDKDEGAGIGLTFSRLVMDIFNGHIELLAAEGEYAEFILKFPRINIQGE